MSLRAVGRSALVLGAIAALATALLAGMQAATRERVEAEAQRQALAAISSLLPAGFDNDPLSDVIEVTDAEAFGTEVPVRIHRARRSGHPLSVVIPVIAPDGYSGEIHLLVGITADGRTIGARVTRHSETPGLGDPIESAKSRWIESLSGRSLDDPPPERWTVKRDGGEFDQFAGATISPRAVVHAVRRALEFVQREGDRLYAPPLPDDGIAKNDRSASRPTVPND